MIQLITGIQQSNERGGRVVHLEIVDATIQLAVRVILDFKWLSNSFIANTPVSWQTYTTQDIFYKITPVLKFLSFKYWVYPDLVSHYISKLNTLAVLLAKVT